ncbi:MAG TPA: YafY family protein [Chloroflexia bacterium]|nr:YafY family protein [Chloroflexia bacterium]
MRADRLIEIILLLQARGKTTAAELATELAVSERTIYRDLDALNQAGIPVYTQGGPGGGISLPDHYRTLLTGVTPADIGAVLIASVSGPLADLGLEKQVQAALRKLVAALPVSQRQAASQYRQRLHLDSAMWFRRPEEVPALPILQEGSETGRVVALRYRRSVDSEVERLFAPYGLVAKAGIWYVVGKTGSNMRVYRVSRVLAAELTGETFIRPAGFDLPAYWVEWCREYEASLPRFTATLWLHPTLAAEMHNNLPIPVVEFAPVAGVSSSGPVYAVTFERIETACSWIVGVGQAAKVVAPVELRELVVQRAAQVLANYSNQEAPSSPRKRR